jgi:hypothetical protein
MSIVKEVNQELLNRFFNSNVVPRIQLNKDETFIDKYSEEELLQIKNIVDKKPTVVGIDIYQYSQFLTEKQMFLPHLFELIYDQSWHLIKQNFAYLFQKYGGIGIIEIKGEPCIDQKNYFINTGDGGYQILETPIHAIIFILTFATILRLYNSDLFMRKLHSKIGNVDMRYAITVDDIYRYRTNHYGAGIINNSRILSKDKLNKYIQVVSG